MYTTLESYNKVCESKQAVNEDIKNEVETSEELEAVIGHPVAVVKVYATWCGPCQRLAAPFKSLMAEFPHIAHTSVNVDSGLIKGVTGLPTILFYRDGEVVNRVMGADLNAIKQAVMDL